MQLNLKDLDIIIDRALSEDIGHGDITSNSTISPSKIAEFHFISREKIVVCGVMVVKRIFHKIDKNIIIKNHCNDGDKIWLEKR